MPMARTTKIIGITINTFIVVMWGIIFLFWWQLFFDDNKPSLVQETNIYPKVIEEGYDGYIYISATFIPVKECFIERTRTVTQLLPGPAKEWNLGFKYLNYPKDKIGKLDKLEFGFRADPTWKKGFYKYQTTNKYYCNTVQQFFPLVSKGRAYYFYIK